MNITIEPWGIWLFGFFTGFAAFGGVMQYLSYRLGRAKQREDTKAFINWLEEQTPDLQEAIKQMGIGADSNG